MSSTRENPTKSYNVKFDDPKINGAHLLKRSHQKKPALPRSTAPISNSASHLLKWLAASLLLFTFVLVPPAPATPILSVPLATFLRLASRSSTPHARLVQAPSCTCPRGTICPNHRPTTCPRHRHLLAPANPYRVYAPPVAAPQTKARAAADSRAAGLASWVPCALRARIAAPCSAPRMPAWPSPSRSPRCAWGYWSSNSFDTVRPYKH